MVSWSSRVGENDTQASPDVLDVVVLDSNLLAQLSSDRESEKICHP